jgi:hypothetical protein
MCSARGREEVVAELKLGLLLRRVAPLAFVSLSTACYPPRDAPSPQAVSSSATQARPNASPLGESPADDAPAVVFVVLDGVRWQEVYGGVDHALAVSHDAGLAARLPHPMPHLRDAIATRGAALGAPGHGSPVRASGPSYLSMPGYVEIFTGRRDGGCADNACAGATSTTLADAMRERAARDEDVAIFASWPPIARAATHVADRIVVSTGRRDVAGARILLADGATREPLERGALANPFPGDGDFRPDRFTAALALGYFEARHPHFMFVGLGEPDEYAHRDDYVGYLASLHAADDFFGALFAALDRMGERGRRTLVLATSDHGRARDYRDHGAAHPESARVWLAAIGGPVVARGYMDARREHNLSDLAPTARLWLGLPPDEAPNAGVPLTELLTPTDASERHASVQ